MALVKEYYKLFPPSPSKPLMSKDAVMEAIKRGDEVISTKGRPFSDELLGYPLRAVYSKRKRALMKVLIFFANHKYPDPDTHPCTGQWTEPFSKAFDKLIAYAKYNHDFWKACKRIVKGEVESDNMYRAPILMMLETLIEEVLDGNLAGRESDTPDERYWSEPKPYGGSASIINQIRDHRKEICDVLGRKYVE